MTFTEKYGKPIGNEIVYGKDIIRRIDTFEFTLVDRFLSNKQANEAYQSWLKENDMSPSKKKQWHYVRPITGWDENGLTFTDSWGEKK
jgi:hypothetical protein